MPETAFVTTAISQDIKNRKDFESIYSFINKTKQIHMQKIFESTRSNLGV